MRKALQTAVPDAVRAEYDEAIRVVPHLVRTESRTTDFLLTEKYNLTAAAQRLAMYWKARKYLFGCQRWLLPLDQPAAVHCRSTMLPCFARTITSCNRGRIEAACKFYLTNRVYFGPRDIPRLVWSFTLPTCMAMFHAPVALPLYTWSIPDDGLHRIWPKNLGIFTEPRCPSNWTKKFWLSKRPNPTSKRCCSTRRIKHSGRPNFAVDNLSP